MAIPTISMVLAFVKLQASFLCAGTSRDNFECLARSEISLRTMKFVSFEETGWTLNFPAHWRQRATLEQRHLSKSGARTFATTAATPRMRLRATRFSDAIFELRVTPAAISMPALHMDIYLESLISKLETEIRSTTSVVIRFSEQLPEKLQRLTIPKVSAFRKISREVSSLIARLEALCLRGDRGRSRSATRIYRGIPTEAQ